MEDKIDIIFCLVICDVNVLDHSLDLITNRYVSGGKKRMKFEVNIYL